MTALPVYAPSLNLCGGGLVVDLCDPEMTEVAAILGTSANVAQLQAFHAAQAKVRAGLQSKGYAPSDVIAADHSGEVLTVYVI